YRVHGEHETVGRLVYVNEDGSVWKDEHVFDSFDLADFPMQLREILEGLDAAERARGRGQVDVNAGAHCKYCPAYRSCSATTGLIQALPDEIRGLGSRDFLTTRDVGEIWARFKDLLAISKKIDEELKAFVRAHPGEVELPDGRVVMEIPKGRDRINGERALAIARSYGATDAELLGCVSRSEWTELRAMNPKKKGRAA
ncbi:MAG: hypothetical protein JOZ84_02735, partial [Methylobacteriaceae bacterium]|nr:hypothetical protein [Methylobacteriaceae bacterium]